MNRWAMPRWSRLEQCGDVPLARSSNSLTVVGGKAYCIGGENQPRVPISSDVHVYDVQTANSKWSAVGVAANGLSPRIGYTAVVAGQEHIYIFVGNVALIWVKARDETCCVEHTPHEYDFTRFDGCHNT